MRTFFFSEDAPNVIYSTTQRVGTWVCSNLNCEQYVETWATIEVTKQAKRDVEDILYAEIGEYWDKTKNRYVLTVGDVDDCDISARGYQIGELYRTKGVEVDEMCTFEGFWDPCDPNGGAMIFYRDYDGDRIETGWEVLDDTDLIAKLNDYLDHKYRAQDNDNYRYNQYYNDDYPEWSCTSSNMSDDGWYDYCINLDGDDDDD